jgi:uncharacterized membrane protein required for colicin V production
MLGTLTVLIMGIVAFAFFQEGILTAAAMFVNVFLAGLVAFGFWEPIAALLEPHLASNGLRDYLDFLLLAVLFCATLALLRWATNGLAKNVIEFHPAILHGGGAVFGLMTGYLLSGILVCMLQTLPLPVHFMNFEAEYKPEAASASVRRVLPPDHVWLATMHRAGLYALSAGRPTFDKNGSFELRYARYRRYTEDGEPQPYRGEASPPKD